MWRALWQWLRWLCRARPPIYSSALRAALFPPEEAHGQTAEHSRIGCEDQERRRRDEPLEHRVLDRFYRGAERGEVAMSLSAAGMSCVG